MARHEVIHFPAGSCGKPPQLGGCHVYGERQIESGEARSLALADGGRDVSCRHRRVSVGLDENALGQGFDNAEDPAVLPGCEQVDGLLVVQHLVRGEQPVVGRLGFEYA